MNIAFARICHLISINAVNSTAGKLVFTMVVLALLTVLSDSEVFSKSVKFSEQWEVSMSLTKDAC